MKQIHYLLFFTLCIAIFGCQKEFLQTNEDRIMGQWKQVMFVSTTVDTVTAANPCFADNTIDFRWDKTATLSQGECVEYPTKPKDLVFNWKFLGDDVLYLGGDTVTITKLTDTELHVKRMPKYLEYHWVKPDSKN